MRPILGVRIEDEDRPMQPSSVFPQGIDRLSREQGRRGQQASGDEGTCQSEVHVIAPLTFNMTSVVCTKWSPFLVSSVNRPQH